MIIDFRCRPATKEFVEVGVTGPFSQLLAGRLPAISTVEALVEAMDDLGIDKGVACGRDVETTFGFKVPNEHIADIVRQFPDRFIGFAGVDPHKGLAALREIDRCVGEWGFKGVSLDGFCHKVPVSDKKLYPIYGKCAEMGLPIIHTTGQGTLIPGVVMDHGHPRHFDEVATDFPELVLVISHGCWPFVLDVIALAQRHRNVYFEFSVRERLPGGEFYVQAANTIIADKVLFASGNPYGRVASVRLYKEELPFSEEVRRKVLGENAARILGL
ncbi:MAG: amidohydrolase [Chloroflexi bacterium]|nr:amidohydrolase [Chloroflexota bacterium]